MPNNIGYIYCELCKRYYIDVFYFHHQKCCKYLCNSFEKKYDFL